MTNKHFGLQLEEMVLSKKNAVCVGLDPRLDLLPMEFQSICESSQENPKAAMAEAYRKFCFGVIDVVAPLVPVVKPQVAFFEALGAEGMVALAKIIQHATQNGLLVIADAKRHDIGSTAEAYAQAWLGRGPQSSWGSDALTVGPYLGEDSMAPFVEQCSTTSSGIFVLVKTSNRGSGFIQDLPIDNHQVLDRVADWVQATSASLASNSQYGPIGAVVGATYPEQLARLRTKMKSAWFLIPGYGAQGGDAKDVAYGFDERGLGAIVNSSRGILSAHQQPKYVQLSWQRAVEEATREMIHALNQVTRLQ